jgi:hypothetical protein
MSNIAPITPSFTLSYWKPWKEESNLFDSWTNYIKDVSLAKYSADTIGQYIEQSSKNQVLTLNSIGEKLGENLLDISNKIDFSNELLINLNRNIDFLNEQHKLTNLLLEDISKLLRIPDSEKNRQHKIELGLKFFTNAKFDNDLYYDALEQLLFAESMYKQDYFVLYRIGLIYLHVPNLLDIDKAIDYFKRAAKYSLVETDKNAAKLFDILNKKYAKNESNVDELFIYKITIDSDMQDCTLIDLIDYFEGDYSKILSVSKNDYSYPISFMVSFDEKLNIEDFYDDMDRLGFSEKKRDFKFEKINDLISLEDSIKIITSESYDKIALSFYLKGDFNQAVTFQEKCVQLDDKLSNKIILAKYQIRNNQVSKAKETIKIVVESDWEFYPLFYSDLDFISNEEIVKYLDEFQNKLNYEFLQLSNKIYAKEILNFKIDEIEYDKFSLTKKIKILYDYKSIYTKLETEETELLKSKIIEEKKKQVDLVLDLVSKISAIFDKHISGRVYEGINQINHLSKDCPNRIITKQYEGLTLFNPFNGRNLALGPRFKNTNSIYFIEVFHYFIFQKDGFYQMQYSVVSVAVDYIEMGKFVNENDINDVKTVIQTILEFESKTSFWQQQSLSNFKDVPYMTNRIEFIINNIGNQHLFSRNNTNSDNCFVATATLGDINHLIVKDLREFRDQYLLKRQWGIKFTLWYYVYGKIAADYIKNSKSLKIVSFILVVKPLHMLVKHIYFKSK